jgi:hypothetical protein
VERAPALATGYLGETAVAAKEGERSMESRSRQPVDYKTHILIAVRGDGVMTVIFDWPHVPTLTEVQEQINGTRNGYVAFALCTPTSILTVPAQDPSDSRPRSRWS